MTNNTSSVRLQEIDAQLYGLIKKIYASIRPLVKNLKENPFEVAEVICLGMLDSINGVIREEANWSLIREGSQILKSGEVSSDAYNDETGVLRAVYVQVIADETLSPKDKIKLMAEMLEQFNIRYNRLFIENLPAKAEAFAREYNIRPPVNKSGINFECSAVLDFSDKSVAIYSDPENLVFLPFGKPNHYLTVIGKQIMIEVDKTSGEIQISAAAKAFAEVVINGQKVELNIEKAEPVIVGEGRVKQAIVQKLDSSYPRYRASRGERVSYAELKKGEVFTHAEFVKIKAALAESETRPGNKNIAVENASLISEKLAAQSFMAA